MLNEKERIEFYNYCLKTGFIVKSVENWSEKKKYKKIKQYMRQGWRIIIHEHSEYELRNIFDKEFNQRKAENVWKLLDWLQDNGSVNN